MRTAFIETLCELAEADERVWLLCGDLGYSVLEGFASRFSDRFVNIGVAEQNMTGIAAGLALAGKVVFTYSIANFPVMRCLEQIRNDVCYHNLDVKIVAVGGGFTYGAQGYTHHGIEDLAVMRVLPNMAVLAPGDPHEVRLATRAIVERPGPCYLRLGKAGEIVVHPAPPDFALGRAIELCPGDDLTIVSIGGMLDTARRASVTLARRGYAAQVLSMPTLTPLDYDAVFTAARRTGKMITIEEHGPGGLGSVVAEALAEAGISVRFAPMRLSREVVTTAGGQETLRAAHGLSVDAVVQIATMLIDAASDAPR